MQPLNPWYMALDDTIKTLDNITQVKTAKHDIANLEGFELCVPYTQSFTKLHLNVFTSTGIPTKLNCTD